MPKVNSLLEIVLFVEDLNRSATFYSEVIGLPQSNDGVFVVAAGQLLLFAKQGTTDVPKQLPGGTIPTCGAVGSQHVAFAVAAAEFESWRQHLLAHGIVDLSEVRWERGGAASISAIRTGIYWNWQRLVFGRYTEQRHKLTRLLV